MCDVRIERVADILTQGGEGPHWSSSEQALYWVNGRGRQVCRYDSASGRVDTWPMPAFTSVITTTQSGKLLVTLAHRLCLLDRQSGELETYLAPELPEGTQFADGKADRQGRLILTSSDRAFTRPSGCVFRLDNQRLVLLDEDYILSNGPCWSPDGTTFYCADSKRRAIFAYDYDIASASVGGRRVFTTTDAIGGIADGATVDRSGRLWMAFCVVGKVVCFNPDGTVAQVIDMPTTGTTSLMFGGPQLNRLFVTSMDVSLFGHPRSDRGGELLVIDGLDAQGIAEIPVML